MKTAEGVSSYLKMHLYIEVDYDKRNSAQK